MTLFIKNMVCNRCILAVRDILKGMNFPVTRIGLGEVELEKELNEKEKQLLKNKLETLGFELLDNSQQQLIEKVKSVIISQIQNTGNKPVNYSELLSQTLNRDYSSLSKLFSATEGVTIEHYVILQKIEKVKELLSYDEMNLSEISYQLGYSSVAHLSAQFKKVTGLTPSQFKAQGIKLRKSLDQI